MNLLGIHFQNLRKQSNHTEECIVGWWKTAAGWSKKDVAILLAEIRQLQVGVLQRPGPAIAMYFENQSASAAWASYRNVHVHRHVLAHERVVAGCRARDATWSAGYLRRRDGCEQHQYQDAHGNAR
jgi:hypothetical protein